MTAKEEGSKAAEAAQPVEAEEDGGAAGGAEKRRREAESHVFIYKINQVESPPCSVQSQKKKHPNIR